MKREFRSIMAATRVAFDFRLRQELEDAGVLSYLILVKFEGGCRMDLPRVAKPDRGPYAMTHVINGEVLPFGVVWCDRVRTAVRSSIMGDHRKSGDFYLGRALARVLAHEMYHILGKTRGHGSRGVAKTALSGEELLADRLALELSDVVRIREAGM